jgi:hypothetical protein
VTAGDRHADADAIPALGGQPGPVLVIADNEAIARRAPAWAAGFSACGRLHRVRLAGPVAGDVDGLVAEAVDLAATAILAAGGEAALHAGRAVAARLGLPLALESDRTVFAK